MSLLHGLGGPYGPPSDSCVGAAPWVSWARGWTWKAGPPRPSLIPTPPPPLAGWRLAALVATQRRLVKLPR
eukprot:7463699-Pyramimonas_sp.AAC.1